MNIKSGMSSQPKGVRRLRREVYWLRVAFIFYVIGDQVLSTVVYFK